MLHGPNRFPPCYQVSNIEQVAGEIVTIEVPEHVKKQFPGEDFQKWHDDFLGRNPLTKTFEGKKTKDSTKNQKQGGQLTPTVSKKRPLSKDLSTWMHGLDTLPIDDEIIAEVPILNCKAGAGVKLSTMPTLCLSKKTGIYVKNQTGHEVPYYFQLVTVLFALTSHQS